MYIQKKKRSSSKVNESGFPHRNFSLTLNVKLLPISDHIPRAGWRYGAVVVSERPAGERVGDTVTDHTEERERERGPAEHARNRNTARQECPLHIAHSWHCVTGIARSVNRPKHAHNPNSSARPCAYHRCSVLPVHTRPVCAGKLRERGDPGLVALADCCTFINAYLALC